MKERKWKSILSQLTEGVLILESTQEGAKPKVFFSNSSLIQMIRLEEQRHGKDFQEPTFILEKFLTTSYKKRKSDKSKNDLNESSSSNQSLEEIFREIFYKMAFSGV